MNGPEREKNWTSAPQTCTNWWYELEQMANPIFDEGPFGVSLFFPDWQSWSGRNWCGAALRRGALRFRGVSVFVPDWQSWSDRDWCGALSFRGVSLFVPGWQSWSGRDWCGAAWRGALSFRWVSSFVPDWQSCSGKDWCGASWCGALSFCGVSLSNEQSRLGSGRDDSIFVPLLCRQKPPSICLLWRVDIYILLLRCKRDWRPYILLRTRLPWKRPGRAPRPRRKSGNYFLTSIMIAKHGGQHGNKRHEMSTCLKTLWDVHLKLSENKVQVSWPQFVRDAFHFDVGTVQRSSPRSHLFSKSTPRLAIQCKPVWSCTRDAFLLQRSVFCPFTHSRNYYFTIVFNDLISLFLICTCGSSFTFNCVVSRKSIWALSYIMQPEQMSHWKRE